MLPDGKSSFVLEKPLISRVSFYPRWWRNRFINGIEKAHATLIVKGGYYRDYRNFFYYESAGKYNDSLPEQPRLFRQMEREADRGAITALPARDRQPSTRPPYPSTSILTM